LSYLGIDAGSSYIKLWHEDFSGNVLYSRSVHHGGSPARTVRDEMERLLPAPGAVCISGSLGGDGVGLWRRDGLLSEIGYLKEHYPHRSLLVFGAEKIELVHYDDYGGILLYRTNPACAAGTGSFLDEQMLRLGLEFSGLEEIPIMEDAPLVATRCAVFAKTDLIHLQQEGRSAHAMYNGLCRGLVLSSLKSVFGGDLPDGSDMLATGGLLANPHVRHFLRMAFPRITISDTPAFTRARGLCLDARRNGLAAKDFEAMLREYREPAAGMDAFEPLALKRSTFPETEMVRRVDVLGNEVWHDLDRGESVRGYLGVDVGSTSTKAVLTDEEGGIRLDIYTRTAGNPVEAVRHIFEGIRTVMDDTGSGCTIRGCGTTGSGRKLVGMVIGADLIVNEISAHAKGALTLDAHAETIFEIGGQDAKFIRLTDGRIVDVNMNYVCAAGTGSFVEEQARTLGMDLDEIGPMVMGVTPLPNSDRCTVFMNQEITRQLASGLPRSRIMAGVLLAVFKNYLGKVVGHRPYSRKRIVFQGATARNKGLVAALEQLTGAEIMVSPFSHVMGAYGAALLTRDKIGRETAFKGFVIPDVSVRETICRGCENTCRITHVLSGGEKTSWGYLCGREPGVQARGRRPNRSIEARNALLGRYAHVAAGRRLTIKMPALGLNEEFMPLLGEVMRSCGITIELCRPDRSAVLRELSSLGSGDFCHPLKVAMACVHVILKEDPSCRVLLPHLIQDEKDPAVHPRSLYCPFITGMPGFFRDHALSHRILAPQIDLGRPLTGQAELMRMTILDAGLPAASALRIRAALKKGVARLRQYRSELSAQAEAVLGEADRGQNIVVLLGRPYNLYHPILNLGIPELIESLGYTVITMDAVPDDASNRDVCGLFPDMYWNQGMKILRKVLSLRRRPNLYPLMISNFSCGPDSFVLTYFEQICRDRPYLILELDEHGSATGYQTRIEAFLDMIEQHAPTVMPAQEPTRPSRIRYSLRDIPDNATVWIPQIHPYIPQLWASVLNRHGIDARATGEETAGECASGRALCRGSECLPAAVTTGKFLSKIRESSADHTHVLFMPRAEGPCRFGQYATLQSMILGNADIKNTFIFSPTSEDGYAFLNRKTELEVWKAICLGDALYKLRCRIVPYHDRPEAAEALVGKAVDEICNLIRAGRDWSDTARSLSDALGARDCLVRDPRPLVGIVGEIFVRLNLFSNQHVVEAVEAQGGEAWLSPMAEWVHYVWEILARKSPLMKSLKTRLKSHIIHRAEREIMDLFSPVLDDRCEPPMDKVLAEGQRFIPLSFEGESILTIGRARLFAEQGARLVVNCSPFGCMPGRITSYLFQTFHGHFKVPVVNLFFDGTGDTAGQIGVYLRSITRNDGLEPSIYGIFRKPGDRVRVRSGGKACEGETRTVS